MYGSISILLLRYTVSDNGQGCEHLRGEGDHGERCVSRYSGVYVKSKEIVGGVKLAFEMCAYLSFNMLNCFSVPCDQGIIDVEKDKAGAVFIKVSINARFIGTGLESY